MTKIANSTFIDAAPLKVWAFINNLDRKPEYVHFVEEVFNISSLPIREGTKYQERARFGPRDSISDWVFVQFDPPRHQVQQSLSKKMNATFTASLEPERGGTLLSVEMDVCLFPAFRPVGWIIEQLIVRRKMKSDVALTLKTLRLLIETEKEGNQ